MPLYGLWGHVGDILSVSALAPLSRCCSDRHQCHRGKELHVPSNKDKALSYLGLLGVCNWVISRWNSIIRKSAWVWVVVQRWRTNTELTTVFHYNGCLMMLISVVELVSVGLRTHFQRDSCLITVVHQVTMKAEYFQGWILILYWYLYLCTLLLLLF